MYPKQHILFGMVFAIILISIFPKIGFTGFVIVFLSSVLIDVDHYLYYIYKKKDFNLNKAIKWFTKEEKYFSSLSRGERNKFYMGFFFLHGIEVVLIILILAIFVSKYFLFIFLGISFHLLLDYLYQPLYWDRIEKISLIYDYFNNKNLKLLQDY